MKLNKLAVLTLVVLFGVVVILGIRQLTDHSSMPVRDVPLTLPPPPEIDPNQIDDLLPRDSIRSIDQPVYESAAAADQVVKPDERVIGLVINGDERAYPINILSNHEIVNDTVGGEPVAVTWCPLCFSALVFSRRIADQPDPLAFGVSGKLLYNTLVMFDRQTDTLWSQLYGVGIEGQLTDTTLAVFPSQVTEWAAWKERHPETQVLSKRDTCEQFNCGTYATNPRGSYVVDPYEAYYNTPLEGVINNQIPRESGNRSIKDRVLGVRMGERTRAYPFDVLADIGLINDQLDGIPILVWFDAETQTGVAYDRRLDGEALVFTADPTNTALLVDDKTNSLWEASTGSAVDGSLAGRQLVGVISTPAFEFGWFDYFPQSDVYQPDL